MAKLNSLAGQLLGRLKIARQGDEVTIVRDHRSGCTALFMGVWLTGWTVGCCAMTWALISGQKDMPWMFPIPFYVGEVIGLVVFLSALTHREFVRLDRDGFSYCRSVVFRLGSHRIPLDELESFTITAQTLDTDGNPVHAKTDVGQLAAGFGAINAEGIGMPFPFFGTVSADDAQEATKELNSVLAILRPTVSSASSNASLRPPAGSVWRQTNEDDCVRLDRSSRATFSSILVTLGIASFWNSITGIFTGILWGWFPMDNRPKGGEWWFLFFFLIPFQLIGAFLLFALASTIWEWLVRESWRLYRGRLVLSKSLLGIPVGSKAYENIDCLRLDCLPEKEAPQPAAKSNSASTDAADLPPFKPEGSDAKPPMTFVPDGKPIEVNAPEPPKTQTWKLVFVKRDETPLVEWKGLSYGEARWLGSTVLLERPNWFRETG